VNATAKIDFTRRRRCPVDATGASSRIATGWTAGAGGEYALSRNWTLRAEYLYVNLGRNSFPEVVVAPGPVDSFTASFNPTAFHVVRGAVNYRF